MTDEWRLRAACRGKDLAIFFPNGGDRHDEAEKTCAACPVRDTCLADALRVLDVHGYRGGTTGDERAAMVANRRGRRATGARMAEDILRLHARHWSSDRIARWVGTTRETVWRRISQSRQDGTVT
jgi:WhiB family redox-sensing transcriptional regulator